MKNKPYLPKESVQEAFAAQLIKNKENRHLARVLWRQGADLYQRFAHFYRQLNTLPRKWRRVIRRKVAPTLAAALLLVMGLPLTQQVYAANITVDGTTCNPGRCHYRRQYRYRHRRLRCRQRRRHHHPENQRHSGRSLARHHQ